jgi:hypothetical protein
LGWLQVERSWNGSREPVVHSVHSGHWATHILGLPALADDEILQQILIRAATLADDDKIASSKLLKQIRS